MPSEAGVCAPMSKLQRVVPVKPSYKPESETICERLIKSNVRHCYDYKCNWASWLRLGASAAFGSSLITQGIKQSLNLWLPFSYWPLLVAPVLAPPFSTGYPCLSSLLLRNLLSHNIRRSKIEL